MIDRWHIRVFVSLWTLTMPASGWAHSGSEGRGFEIMVVDDQIVGQGVNTGNDDGQDSVRPYYNAIHDHWKNIAGTSVAQTDRPLLYLTNPDPALIGHDLTLTLTGVSKWLNPPMMPMEGTVPNLVNIGPSESVWLSHGGQLVDSNSPGSITLLDSVTDQATDFHVYYGINDQPEGVLYVVEMELGSSNPNVFTSDTLHAIISPDGVTMSEKLHHASLYLESYLGTTASVPEPASASILGLGGLLVTRWLRGRSSTLGHSNLV